ncbi:uncharacterized protein LOC143487696 [Brachyhypopomus gauderio]|uniref:uncharacterized protein LOC143487696 n=1 Tax=Brachyhypopomus gauderio TaxID=698409 RepID=UPI004041FFD1
MYITMRETSLHWVFGLSVFFSGAVSSLNVTVAPETSTATVAASSNFTIDIKITNRIYNESLKDQKSQQYQTLRQEVEEMFSSTFGHSPSVHFQGVSEMTFSNGSVIASSITMFGTSQINESVVENTFADNYDKDNSSSLVLNINYTKVAKLTVTPTSTTRETTTHPTSTSESTTRETSTHPTSTSESTTRETTTHPTSTSESTTRETSTHPTSTSGSTNRETSTSGSTTRETSTHPTSTSGSTNRETSTHPTSVFFSGAVSSPNVTVAPKTSTATVAASSNFTIDIKITNRIYNESLKDQKSQQYQTLRQEVEKMFSSTFGHSPSVHYQGVSEMTFSNGSVIASSVTMFGTSRINESVVENTFADNYDKDNSSSLVLNISYTKVAKLTVTPPTSLTNGTTTVSPHKVTSTEAGAVGAGQGVPGWGVAILVLAAIILFLFLILLLLLLLCWCCCWRRRGFMSLSEPTSLGYYNPDIPMYSTQSTYEHNGKPSETHSQKPSKTRTGTYLVNQ